MVRRFDDAPCRLPTSSKIPEQPPMTLVALARNPVPSGAIAGLFQGYDGAPLRFARWSETTGACRGTVVIVSGRTEFIEKYFETIADLRRRGFAVAIMDLRGQGGSKRLLDNPLKGHVRHFRDYDYDLALFMKEVVIPNMPRPYLALGHSLGSHILMRLAGIAECPFERMILVGTMLDISPQQLTMPKAAVRGFTEVAAGIGLSSLYLPLTRRGPMTDIPFELNEVTSDRERYIRATSVAAAAPELALGAPTIGWLRAALRSCATLAAVDYPARVRVPVLMVAAGRDTIVSTRAIEDFVPRVKLGTLALIGTSKHEVLQETDDIRGRFWASFDAYTEAIRAAA
jgi:lysophospholipase